MAQITTITFDLWQTLIIDTPELSRPRAERRLRGVLEILEAAGHPSTMESLGAAYQRCLRVCEEVRAAEADVTFDEQIDIFLHEVDEALPVGLDARARALVCERYASSYLDHPPRIDEGAHRVLEAARKKGWKVGLICNTGATPGSTQRTFLDEAGLARYFDTLVFSDEERLSKPALQIFQLALERLEALPEHTVHIGDHPLNDVVGAKRAGLRAIWLARGDASQPTIAPDATIHTLEEAMEALSNL